MKDENFKNKCAEIFRGELQLIGMKMLFVLKPEDKKSFLDQVYSSVAPSYALRVWADYVCTPIADNDILREGEKRDFPRTHLSDIIGNIGFIPTVVWLRELPNYRNFENRVNALSKFLLDSQSLKSYVMFDSAFFPCTNKV